MSISHMIKWVWNGSLNEAEQYSLLMPLQYHVISMTISFISPWNSNDKTDILLKVIINTITPHPPPPWNRPISYVLCLTRDIVLLPISHVLPLKSSAQVQVKMFIPSTQVPPFRHVPVLQSSMSENKIRFVYGYWEWKWLIVGNANWRHIWNLWML